jgi:DNA-binding transcriptional regulator YiaG
MDLPPDGMRSRGQTYLNSDPDAKSGCAGSKENSAHFRGAEVQFLRKALGLSLDKFGRMLGLSGPAILKWERAREKRLHPLNEVAVRALLAEKLEIPLEGKFSTLRGMPRTPERILMQVV